MSTVRSLAILKGGEPGVEVTPIVESSESAWGETNPVDGTASKDDKDNPGPLHDRPGRREGGAGDPADAALRRGAARGLRRRRLGDERLRATPRQRRPVPEHRQLARGTERQDRHPAQDRAASQLFLSVEQLGNLKFFSMDILPVLLVAWAWASSCCAGSAEAERDPPHETSGRARAVLAAAGVGALLVFWQVRHAAEESAGRAPARRYLRLEDPASVRTIALRTPNGAFTLTREQPTGERAWKLADASRTTLAEKSTVDALVGHLSELRRTREVGETDETAG